jgi:putative transposase
MRQRRLVPKHQDTVFHLISRCSRRELLLDAPAIKEYMRQLLWRTADFCGVEVITFALMGNHFHILARVPEKVAADARITHQELLRRVEKLDGPLKAAFLAALHPDAVRTAAHEQDGHPLNPAADETAVHRWSKVRDAYLVRMHDVSQFMKLFKERCSAWFNKEFTTFGTLWAERFKSLIVENRAEVIRAVALYIDLNPVRAGLVDDPKEYRWCGYAEAVAGHRGLRKQLSAAMEKEDWREGGPSYRLWLAGKGQRSDAHRGKRAMSEALVAEIEANHGELTWRERLRDRLRHRVRQFSDGGALGSAEFVARMKALFRPRNTDPASEDFHGSPLRAGSTEAMATNDDPLSAMGVVTFRRLRRQAGSPLSSMSEKTGTKPSLEP